MEKGRPLLNRVPSKARRLPRYAQRPSSHNFFVTEEGSPPYQAGPVYDGVPVPETHRTYMLRGWVAPRRPSLQPPMDHHGKTQERRHPHPQTSTHLSGNIELCQEIGRKMENVKPCSLPSWFLLFHHKRFSQQPPVSATSLESPRGRVLSSHQLETLRGRALSSTLLNAPAA